MTNTQKLLLTGIAAATLGAAGVFLATIALITADEDRPPIIVKGGGSLIIDSGTTGRPGKPWKKAADGTEQYYPDHDRGKSVVAFQLYFVGGTVGQGPCLPTRVENFTVKFDHDDDSSTPPKMYTFNIQPDSALGSHKGKQVPVISGPDLTSVSGTNSLTAGEHLKGTLTSVTVSSFQCDRPLQVWAESVGQ